ncbi:MAG TPA: ferritin-like domain-containing protein [Chromobacteriaceae bacterium]|nr:ferritin-like domain-containing protein [Chromobacteriaceae bacterium]
MQQPVPLSANWNLDQIPWAGIHADRVRQREDVFYLVAAASFIEITSELYTDNLTQRFADDEVVTAWLHDHWQKEETRHGRVLRTYVEQVWPEFDWPQAYRAFVADYSQLCTMEQLEPTRGLELVARCVVETGTATFYQALAACADEPVLVGLALQIRAEEIDHYKHFFRYFRQYRQGEQTSRLQVMAALKRRALEARRGDAECALWHVYGVRQGLARANRADFKALSRRLLQQIQAYYPIEMAAKMLLRPLDLPAGVSHALQGPLSHATRWMLR